MDHSVPNSLTMDPSDYTLTLPPSVLMHVCLAHLHPSYLTFTSITSSPPPPTTSTQPLSSHTPRLSSTPLPTLPPDLHPLISLSLLHTLTNTLLTSTASALKSYERQISQSCCADCRAYFSQVFGQCVWEWEGFRGCACGERAKRVRMAREAVFGSLLWGFVGWVFGVVARVRRWGVGKEEGKAEMKEVKRPEIQVFPTPNAWLQNYLSSHPLLTPYEDGRDIWDVVDRVLASYGCSILSPLPPTMQTRRKRSSPLPLLASSPTTHRSRININLEGVISPSHWYAERGLVPSKMSGSTQGTIGMIVIGAKESWQIDKFRKVYVDGGVESEFESLGMGRSRLEVDDSKRETADLADLVAPGMMDLPDVDEEIDRSPTKSQSRTAPSSELGWVVGFLVVCVCFRVFGVHGARFWCGF